MKISGFVFAEMTHREARQVTDWKYPPPYDFYDMTADDEDLRAWLLPTGDEGRYSVFMDSHPEDLAGFLSFGEDTKVPGGDYPPGVLDIGLGMHPDLVGRGIGLSFFRAGLEFARQSFSPAGFRLSVAEFNERAITVYRRAGFEMTAKFTSQSGHPFILMEREA